MTIQKRVAPMKRERKSPKAIRVEKRTKQPKAMRAEPDAPLQVQMNIICKYVTIAESECLL